jgi:hypothetical protein
MGSVKGNVAFFENLSKKKIDEKPVPYKEVSQFAQLLLLVRKPGRAKVGQGAVDAFWGLN